MIKSKLCCRCNKNLPPELFGKHKRYKDGLQPACLDCTREYRANWKQQKLSIDPDYFNRESRMRREKNPGRSREYKRKWRENNLEAARLSARRYARKKYASNSGEMREYQNNWREKNRHKTTSYKQARRMRIYSGGVFDIRDSEIKALYDSLCLMCGSKDNIEIDHVMPISRGGNNSIGNLIPLCRTCNRSKGNKTFMEWRVFRMRDKND